jgi:pimeloyl-ACP methyl ester carboxylesterase
VPETALRADDVLDAFLAALPADQEVDLVPHSNAGAFVPALTVRRPVAPVVFVDAVFPPPGGQDSARTPGLARQPAREG